MSEEAQGTGTVCSRQPQALYSLRTRVADQWGSLADTTFNARSKLMSHVRRHMNTAHKMRKLKLRDFRRRSDPGSSVMRD